MSTFRPSKVSCTQDLVEKYMLNEQKKKKKKNLSEEVLKWF